MEAHVAEDPRVVNHDIELPVGIERRLHDALAFLDRVVVRRRFATGCFDLRDDRIGRTRALAIAVHRAAEVVHDHACPATRELKRVGAPESAARARNDHYPAIETQLTHNHASPIIACATRRRRQLFRTQSFARETFPTGARSSTVVEDRTVRSQRRSGVRWVVERARGDCDWRRGFHGPRFGRDLGRA